MSKAVLVVDKMPETCKECKYYEDFWCRIENHCPEDDMHENGRASWCPLRLFPLAKEAGETE